MLEALSVEARHRRHRQKTTCDGGWTLAVASVVMDVGCGVAEEAGKVEGVCGCFFGKCVGGFVCSLRIAGLPLVEPNKLPPPSHLQYDLPRLHMKTRRYRFIPGRNETLGLHHRQHQSTSIKCLNFDPQSLATGSVNDHAETTSDTSIIQRAVGRHPVFRSAGACSYNLMIKKRKRTQGRTKMAHKTEMGQDRGKNATHRPTTLVSSNANKGIETTLGPRRTRVHMKEGHAVKVTTQSKNDAPTQTCRHPDKFQRRQRVHTFHTPVELRTSSLR